MTSGSADRTPSERAAEASGETASERAQEARAAGHKGAALEHEPRLEVEQEERFGPLALLRTRKADGRALLLFSHRGKGANGE